jgi:SAM-dependent methyltransferase
MFKNKRKLQQAEAKYSKWRAKYEELQERHSSLKKRYSALKERHEGLMPKAPSTELTAFRNRLKELNLLAPEAQPWMIEEISSPAKPGGPATFRGVVPVPTTSERGLERFTINGRPFDAVRCSASPAVLPHVFWFLEDSSMAAFSLTVDALPTDAREAEVNYTYPGMRSKHSWFVPLHQDSYPIPDEQRRVRVTGDIDYSKFQLGGYTAWRRLDILHEKLTGLCMADAGTILDWGCGCGRVIRHLLATAELAGKKPRVVGADIDADNVQWCRENLPAEFTVVPLLPPTSFKDDEFDLVYSISVFTHLAEDVQFRWLEELRRIVRPGGMVLTTMHGKTAYQYVGMPEGRPELAENWAPEAKGFMVSGSNSQIAGQTDDDDYYLNVFHTREYVLKEWSKFFEVREIIPGFVGTHDLVVLINNK